jgi:hypothetical protein
MNKWDQIRSHLDAELGDRSLSDGVDEDTWEEVLDALVDIIKEFFG